MTLGIFRGFGDHRHRLNDQKLENARTQMTKLCLIIDDGVELDSAAGKYLENSDYKIAQAQTCNEALTMCKQSMPDVILLDADTPKMSGLEFLARLRGTQRGEEPVVLYCAQHEDTTRIGQAIWKGASECLVKPFDTELLAFKLEQSGAF